MESANAKVKTCHTCHQTLPPDHFHKDRTHRDGLSNICKACKATNDRKRERSVYYAKRRRKRSAKGRCPNCGRPKPCVSCGTYQRAYRQRNKDRFAAYRQRYAEARTKQQPEPQETATGHSDDGTVKEINPDETL